MHIICQPFIVADIEPIRLFGGKNNSEGRLEIFRNNHWGTVCNDEFDMADGGVVCRQLGYPGVEAVVAPSVFGAGHQSIMLDDVRCVGDELNITSCPRNIPHNCDHSQDVGVICSK